MTLSLPSSSFIPQEPVVTDRQRPKRDASGREDRWYVARVHPGQERTAECRLLEQAFGVFVPTWTPEGKNRKGEPHTKRPLFPGYIFVQFDIAFDRWQPVNNTRGVMHLLPPGRETPIPIPTAFVERIQARVQAGEFKPAELKDLLAGLVKGETIEIVDGPFAAFPGAFQELRNQGLRLIVEIFGRKTPVDVTPEQVRLPDKRPKPSEEAEAA